MLQTTKPLPALLLMPFATLCFPCVSQAAAPDLGPNVLIVNPSQPATEVQAAIDRIYATQKTSEFGLARSAILFKPSQYKLDVPVGFYTQVLGLAATRSPWKLAQTRVYPRSRKRPSPARSRCSWSMTRTSGVSGSPHLDA